MKKSVLKRTLSIVLACIMMMSIFATLPIQAGAASKISISKCTITVPTVYYTGSLVYPKPTVKYGTKKLNEGTDYSLGYSTSNTKYPGKRQTMYVVGKGSYTGTRTVYFYIEVAKPGSASFKKINENKIKVDWSSVKCDEYEIQGWNGKKWVVLATTFQSVYTAPYYPQYRVRAFVKDPYTRVPTYSSWATFKYYR